MGSEESTRSALSQVSRVKLVLGDANGWNAVGSRRRYAPLAFANRALSEQGLENGFLKQSTVGTSNVSITHYRYRATRTVVRQTRIEAFHQTLKALEAW